jgi:hypothetical protein
VATHKGEKKSAFSEKNTRYVYIRKRQFSEKANIFVTRKSCRQPNIQLRSAMCNLCTRRDGEAVSQRITDLSDELRIERKNSGSGRLRTILNFFLIM